MYALPADDRQDLDRMIRALDVFRQEDADIPLGEVIAFLSIALKENDEVPVKVTDLAEVCGVALSSASRYAQALSDFDRNRAPGKRWVQSIVNPMDRRTKALTVTELGEQVIAKVCSQTAR